MTQTTKGPSRDTVMWAAQRTIDMHGKEGSWKVGGCKTCTAEGCENLDWALKFLALPAVEPADSP